MNGQAYEFTQQENYVIGATAKRAKWWGWISLVIGVFMTLVAFAAFAHRRWGRAERAPSRRASSHRRRVLYQDG